MLLHPHNFIVFKIAKLKFTLPPTPLNMNTSLKAFTGGPKLERIQKENFCSPSRIQSGNSTFE